MKPLATPAGAGSPPTPWHWRTLLLAPHRLAFFLGLVLLAASALWWAAVQLDRSGAGLGLRYAASPSLTHAAVMTFGFFPLFFCGFLFTAGPKWLKVKPPATRTLLPPLLLMAGGWLLWLVAAHVQALAPVAALLLAWCGLATATWRFWQLIRRSREPDRVHATAVGLALLAGCASLAGLALALVLDAPDVARGCVLTGLWGFVMVVYASAAHRMIPFFTSSALPMAERWNSSWVLWLLLAVAVFETLAVWLEPLATPGVFWPVLRGLCELAAAGVLVWLALAWGLAQSMKVRLLAMLHLGFVWLGLGLGLSSLSHLAAALTGAPVLPLGALHAVTMGCFGSLMLAMVTRVSCGHSGRALVADNAVWTLFWLLQVAVVLRVAGAAALWPGRHLLAAAALLWAAVMLIWGCRYGSWYGRPRADGRPG